MEATKLTAGVIVIRRDENEYRCLVLRAYEHWDFPKGHVEKNELPIDAAKREVFEEADIDELHFHWGHVFAETEPYGTGKVARYYIAETSQHKVKLKINPELGKAEHHEFRWVTFSEAKDILVPRVQKILNWAISVLKKSSL